MRLTIFRKGVLLVALPLLFQLALLTLVADMERRQTRAADQVVHTKKVAAEAQGVLLALVDAETGFRGYLITLDPAFLEPYDRSAARLPPALDDVIELLSDSPL